MSGFEQRPLNSWDEELADDLMGRVILVGLTRLNPAGEQIERTELYGHVVSVDRRRGIKLSLSGRREGETYTPPPDTSALQPAALGNYTLNATGETVIDPDYVCSWTSRTRANA